VAKKAPGADQCTEAVDHIEIHKIVPGVHSRRQAGAGPLSGKARYFPLVCPVRQ
jgi:hypothetical protein